MTIAQAIQAADRLRPNEAPLEQKLRWLSELDGQISRDLHATYEDAPAAFDGYDEQPDEGTMALELLVPYPYDGIYLWYLLMQIDLHNNDIVRYNNDAEMLQQQLDGYKMNYNRTHMPKGPVALRF